MAASMDRRKFNQLTAAALGGLTSGVLLGCRQEAAAPEKAPAVATNTAAAGDVHLCRGLNECANQGKGKDNSCRGQGSCATSKEHGCGGMNECKGLGGCGDTAGANECAGKGGCHVPLMDSAWETVRLRMETQWKARSLAYSPAPEEKPAESK